MADVKGEPINIKVKPADGEEIMFKVKTTTQMKKIFDAYATRSGQQKDSLLFMLNGSNVAETDTPASLKLEDGDQIDVLIKQTGGAAGGAAFLY